MAYITPKMNPINIMIQHPTLFSFCGLSGLELLSNI